MDHEVGIWDEELPVDDLDWVGFGPIEDDYGVGPDDDEYPAEDDDDATVDDNGLASLEELLADHRTYSYCSAPQVRPTSDIRGSSRLRATGATSWREFSCARDAAATCRRRR